MTTTLAQALAACGNDHRDHTSAFTTRTGLGWHEPTPAVAAAGTTVSVVIPAHNQAHALGVVLDALAAQDTAGSVEVIVIDDASTDDTPTIAARHPVVDVAYRLPHQLGAAAARNVGTHLAEAATIIYLDADMLLPGHVLADLATRARPNLALVGFRHNLPHRSTDGLLAALAAGEPDLHADHRVRWQPPTGVPMLYSGQVYRQPFVGRPLDDTHDFLDLGNAGRYHDWDLPRMVVTALLAVPRTAVLDVGGFDAGWRTGWGCEDTHLGAALIAGGCLVVPLRQARGWHLDPPDADTRWQAKLATAPARVQQYRRLLEEPVPAGRHAEFTTRVQPLLDAAQRLR